MINKAIEEICKFMWKFNDNYKNRFYCIDKMGIRQVVDIKDKGLESDDDDVDFTSSKIEILNSKYIGSCKFFYSIKDWEKSQKYNIGIANQLAFAVVATAENLSEKHIYTSSLPIIFVEVPNILLEKYLALTISNTSICVKYFACLPEVKQLSIFQRAIVERLDSKSTNVIKGFNLAKNNWIGAFVFSVFDTIEISSEKRKYYNLIAQRIDFYNILSTLNSIDEVEALLFGTAGLLEESFSPDKHMFDLRNTFEFLKRKHNITILNSNRISMVSKSVFHNLAYLSALLFTNKSIFYNVIDCRNLMELKKILNVNVSEYWQTHTCFGVEDSSSQKRETISSSKIDLMIINGIIPYLFTYAKINKLEDDFIGFIFDMYENIPSEENKFISNWNKQGYVCKNAFETQSVIQISKKYCLQNLCSHCDIGQKILSN